jgi:hypothetical protein
VIWRVNGLGAGVSGLAVDSYTGVLFGTPNDNDASRSPLNFSLVCTNKRGVELVVPYTLEITTNTPPERAFTSNPKITLNMGTAANANIASNFFDAGL